jgi:2-oxoglutarate ferredoxin oxidoreductase subunit delta
MPRKFEVRMIPSSCKGCGICVHFCPAGVLEMSEQFTPKGYHPPKNKQGATCTGCRTCELMCPDLAIFVEEAPLTVPHVTTAKGRRRGQK